MIHDPGTGPLVNTTKSIHALSPSFDPNTGEIQDLAAIRGACEPPSFDPTDSTINKYTLQSRSAAILASKSHPNHKQWRVSGCLSRLSGSDVVVVKSYSTERCSYKNLTVCGSVWSCPVCSAKISELRKGELQTAIDTHAAAGGAMYLFTYTFSHNRLDDLSALLGSQSSRSGLADALRRFRNARAYKAALREFGFVGSVRCLEVTYSDQNGWHPHIHELWFVTDPVPTRSLSRLKASLFDLWLSACRDSGLGLPNRKHGLDVRRSLSAAEYLAKFGRSQNWGSSSELTKSHVKHGRQSLTPWDFLRLHPDNPELYGFLFHQYVYAFFGLRQLFWTPGLKAAFGIGEISDQAAAESETPAFPVVSITPELWKRLLRSKRDFRGHVLRLAETGGAPAVLRFLSALA